MWQQRLFRNGHWWEPSSSVADRKAAFVRTSEAALLYALQFVTPSSGDVLVIRVMVADSETSSPGVVKRKIGELRVVDLRNELERRQLDKTGVKALLLDRLSKVNPVAGTVAIELDM